MTANAFPNVYTENALNMFDSMFNGTLPPPEKASALAAQLGLVSAELLYVFTVVNYTLLSISVSLLGIGANAVNIVVFLRQGFQETINVSLLGMAVSDLGLQVMTLFVAVCFMPWLPPGGAMEAGEAISYVAAWIQVTATRITGWVTAFVTFERCLCIVLPLKVKDVISPGRTKGVVVTIFVGATLCIVPVYFTFSIRRIFQPQVNASVLTMLFLEDRAAIQTAMFYLNNVAFPLASFLVVVVCTAILSVGIMRNTRWRRKAASWKEKEGGKVKARVKEWKVIKMVAFIAVVYIVCYTPTISIFVWMVEDSEFSFTGRHRRLFLLLTSFAFLFESINSSLNICIYYSMSSRYRQTFRQLFCKKEV